MKNYHFCVLPAVVAKLLQPLQKRIIEALALSEGLTVPQLVAELKASYMGIKAQCEKLEERGHLSSFRVPRAQPGRPQRIYTLTRLGYDLFRPADLNLVEGVLQSAKQIYGPYAAEKLLFSHYQTQVQLWAKHIEPSDSLETKVRKLIELRLQLGIISSLETSDGVSIIELYHPHANLFATYPALVECELLGLSELAGAQAIRREKSSKRGHDLSLITFVPR